MIIDVWTGHQLKFLGMLYAGGELIFSEAQDRSNEKKKNAFIYIEKFFAKMYMR